MPTCREYCPIAVGAEMHRWLLGWVSLADLQHAGSVRLVGPTRLPQAVIG